MTKQHGVRQQMSLFKCLFIVVILNVAYKHIFYKVLKICYIILFKMYIFFILVSVNESADARRAALSREHPS